MNVSGGTTQLQPTGARIRLVIGAITIGIVLAIVLVTLWPSQAPVPGGGSVPTFKKEYQSGPKSHIGEMAKGRPHR